MQGSYAAKILTFLGLTFSFACQPTSSEQDKKTEDVINESLNSDDVIPKAQGSNLPRIPESEFQLECPTQALAIVDGALVNAHHSLTASVVKIINPNGPCTGTVFGPRHILTAAHCFKNPIDAAGIKIGIGPSGEADLRIKIKAIRIHPQYKGLENLENKSAAPSALFDVAILLSEDVLPGSLRPLSLAPASELTQGRNVYLAGYGAFGDGDYLPRPLTATQSKIAQLAPERNEMQLDSESPTGPCHGDSGGPVLLLDPSRGPSCFLLAGSVTGRGRDQEPGCRSGRATVMDLTRLSDWAQCVYAQWNAAQGLVGENRPPALTDCL